jgi:hypothetical protein
MFERIFADVVTETKVDSGLELALTLALRGHC